MPRPCLRNRLRLATQGLHAAAERHLDLGRPDWTVQSYCRLLERFWGFYFPLEQLLGAIDWRESGVAFGARRKAAWIEADLTYFGKTAESIRDLACCHALPRLDGVAAGLGALYVLEGATLGGRIILRNLQSQLGLAPDAGGRFFGSYGSDVGAMWQEFLAVLEQHGGRPRTAEAISQSAVETFAAFDHWFSAASIRRDDSARQAHV